MRLVQTEASFVATVVTKIKLIVTPFFRTILHLFLIYVQINLILLAFIF